MRFVCSGCVLTGTPALGPIITKSSVHFKLRSRAMFILHEPGENKTQRRLFQVQRQITVSVSYAQSWYLCYQLMKHVPSSTVPRAKNGEILSLQHSPPLLLSARPKKCVVIENLSETSPISAGDLHCLPARMPASIVPQALPATCSAHRERIACNDAHCKKPTVSLLRGGPCRLNAVGCAIIRTSIHGSTGRCDHVQRRLHTGRK
jgi:hypothetical protein